MVWVKVPMVLRVTIDRESERDQVNTSQLVCCQMSIQKSGLQLVKHSVDIA